MQQGSNDSRVLWMGDLDAWMDQTYLTSLIASLGYTKELTAVRLIKDKVTGQQLKYGFLDFSTNESAKNFINNYNHRTIPNTTKHFKLNWATHSSKGNISKTSQSDIQVYIGDLDPAVTEHKLLELFKNKYPSAFNAKVITDTVTKVSKGYGFVKFTNQDQAQRAITEMNGQVIMGKPFKVSTAHLKTKEETQAESQESQGQLLLRQKLYAQFYSSINDPQVKAEYEKQVLKTFGNQESKKPTLKQSLQGVRSLTYSQTLQSLKILEVIPKSVNTSWRTAIEQRIYQ